MGRQEDGRYPSNAMIDDDSIEHVRRLPDALGSVAKLRSVHRRQLRVTYEPGDLSEIAVERVTGWGYPQRDPGNRVLMLEAEDIVWLHAKLGPIVQEIEAAKCGASNSVAIRISESKSSTG